MNYRIALKEPVGEGSYIKGWYCVSERAVVKDVKDASVFIKYSAAVREADRLNKEYVWNRFIIEEVTHDRN
jgi:hypothetical protein